MTKISVLPLAGPIVGDETVPLVQEGETRQLPIGDLADAAAEGSAAAAIAASMAAHEGALDPHPGYLKEADVDTDVSLSANSDSKVPSQKAVKSYVDAAVTGLLDYKGGIDCSGNPNYPAASKGDSYVVTLAGKIGGGSGQTVEAGDFLFAKADNAGGSDASVGASWDILQYNQVPQPRVLTLAITGTALTAGEVLMAFTPPIGETWTFAANFSGASGKKLSGGSNPVSSYVIDVVKNGSSVGNITINTSGVVSFATSGGTAFSLTGGSDEAQIIGPASTDTAVGYAFAILFTVS